MGGNVAGTKQVHGDRWPPKDVAQTHASPPGGPASLWHHGTEQKLSKVGFSVEERASHPRARKSLLWVWVVGAPRWAISKGQLWGYLEIGIGVDLAHTGGNISLSSWGLGWVFLLFLFFFPSKLFFSSLFSRRLENRSSPPPITVLTEPGMLLPFSMGNAMGSSSPGPALRSVGSTPSCPQQLCTPQPLTALQPLESRSLGWGNHSQRLPPAESQGRLQLASSGCREQCETPTPTQAGRGSGTTGTALTFGFWRLGCSCCGHTCALLGGSTHGSGTWTPQPCH